jgi:hypothetical protein
VPLDQFLFQETTTADDEPWPCYSRTAIVSDWPEGVTNLETVVVRDQALNDGGDDYPPGTRLYRYEVTRR